MAYFDIPPPSVESICRQFAEWIAGLFRLNVTISIDDRRGNTHTVVVDRTGVRSGAVDKEVVKEPVPRCQSGDGAAA